MKERLTGAIILVALIVLLVPELLTGPAHPAAVAATAAVSEEPPLRSYTINLTDDARARAQLGSSGPAMPQPGAGEQSGEAQSSDSNQPATSAGTAPSTGSMPSAPHGTLQPPTANTGQSPAASAGAPSSSSSSGSGPAPTPQAPAAQKRSAASTVKKHASGANAWMVQLGVFASRENAEHLAQEMKGKGFKASVSDVTGSGRRLYRVRVGPAPDRAAAQVLQGRLRALGRSGTILPYS